MNGMLPVSVASDPWSGKRVDAFAARGSSCAQIVASVIPDAALHANIEVFIGDHRIPPERWHVVKPKPGSIVSINVLPDGGNGLRIGLQIGVLALAIASSYFTGPAGFGLVSASGAALIGAGVSIAGTLAINYFVPPPTAKPITADTKQDSPTYAFGGATNAFRAWSPVPHLLGTFRFAPPLIGSYTETVGGDQYIRVLLLLTHGMTTTPAIEIGETSIDEFTDVETEFRRGWHPSLITDQGSWNASTGTLPTPSVFGDKYTCVVSGAVAGTIYSINDTIIRNHESDETVPSGWDLNADKQHKLFPSDVFADGFSTQLLYNTPIVKTSQINANELVVEVSFSSLFQVNNKAKREAASVSFKVEQSPTGADTWSDVGTFTVTGRKQTAMYGGYRWATTSGAAENDQWDVRVTRLTEENPTDNNEYFAESFWTQLQTITIENPLGRNVGFATLAMRIRATGQLYGTLNNVSVTCSSIERDWDQTAGEWVYRTTSRPAAHYRTVLQHPLRRDLPLDDSRIDLERLAEWSETDEAAGRTFDAYIDFGTTEERIISDIAAAGNAMPMPRGTVHSVALDEPKATPVRLFSPRNTAGYRGQTIYADLPHAIRVPFINAEKGYTADEIIVYADGYNALTAERFDQREYLGLVTQEANWKRARREMAEAKLRREIHTVTTSVQSLACEQGDLVVLQHNVISVGLFAGRVRAVA